MVRSTNQEDIHYVIFSIIVLLPLRLRHLPQHLNLEDPHRMFLP